MQAARRTTDALEGYSRRARGWVQRRAWVVGGTPTRAPKKYTPLGPGLTSYVYGGGGAEMAKAERRLVGMFGATGRSRFL